MERFRGVMLCRIADLSPLQLRGFLTPSPRMLLLGVEGRVVEVVRRGRQAGHTHTSAIVTAVAASR
jgi:hypothetical protein